MIEFDDLTDVQQQALKDAFGEPEDYQPPRFSRVDDPVDAAGYEVFRDSMEGMYVDQGEMSDERFDSYLSRGILREGDGEIVVNSVWRDSQVEELQENEMVDFDAIGLYESDNRDDMVVMDTGDGFRFDIRDGSLTYELPGTASVNDAEYESGEKVEEITEDFVRFFASVEDEEDVNSGYENTLSSKPEEKLKDGGDIMTDDDPDYSGDELDTIVSNVRRLKESLEGMSEDELDVEGVQGELDDYIDQVENLEGQLRELQSDIDDLEGELDESEEAFERYQEVLGYANELLLTEQDGDEMGIIPELESRMGGLGTDLDDIYDKIDSAYDELRDTLDEEWGSDWDGMADETASRVQSVLDNGEDYVEEIKGMKEDFYDEDDE